MLIVNKAFATGPTLEQAYKIPANASSVALQAITHNVDMRLTTGTGDDHWTLKVGSPESINNRNLIGTTLFFTSVDGAGLQIRVLTGSMC